MSFIFVFFIGLVFFAFTAALALVWAASLGLFLLGKVKGSKVLSWLGGVPLVASSLVGIALVLVIAYIAIYIGISIVHSIFQL